MQKSIRSASPIRSTIMHPNTSRVTSGIATIGASLALTACGVDPPLPEPPLSTTPESRLTGVIDVRLHDAPLDAKAIVVTVERLRFRPCNGGSFIELDVTNGPLDLLKLQDGVLAQLLDDAKLPVGRYCEARLVLTEPSTLLDSSDVLHVLKTPSGSSSGFKIKGEFQIIPGDIRTILTVDFDAEQSIHSWGKNDYILEPVVHIESVEYETVSGGAVPPGEYLDYTAFTVDPSANSTIDLGGGSQLTFFPGAVLEATTFVATRWAPKSDDIRSDLFRFSPHYQFLVPPYLELSYQDDGRPGQIHLDYDVLPTIYSAGVASASLPHFSLTDEQASPCSSPGAEGYYCDSTNTRLYKCDGTGQSEVEIACDCVPRGENIDDGCYWPEAPWSSCVALSPARSEPYHDGEYRADNIDVALDFTPLGATPDLLCGFEECEVSFNCRDVDGNANGWAGYGNNVCIYEKKGGQKTNRWMFVAHLASLVVDPTVTPTADYAWGEALGVMGDTGEATGVHFHIEFGADGDATKLAAAGDFPPPFIDDVKANMPFCGGAPPKSPVDPPSETPPPILDPPPPPSPSCNTPEPVDPNCQVSFSDLQNADNCYFCDAVHTLACVGIVKGYSDGSFLPAGNVTRAEFLKLVLETAYPCEDFGAVDVPEAPFPDVPATDWFATYVTYAKNHGIVEGKYNEKYNAIVFLPNTPVLREEAAKMMVAAASKSSVPGYANLFDAFDPAVVINDAAEFADVKEPTEWYYPYVYAARAANVFTGYGGTNLFGIGNPINRGDAALVVYRAGGY